MDILNVSKSIFDPFDGYYKDYPIVIDTLTFSDSFTESTTHTISQSLSLSDAFTLEGDFEKSLSDNLLLNSYFILFNPLVLVDNLTFSDIFESPDHPESISQSLTFSQTFTTHLVRKPSFSDLLWFEDRLIPSFSYKPQINDNLLFVDSIGLHGHFSASFSDHLNFSENEVFERFDNDEVSLNTWIVSKDNKNYPNVFIILQSLTSAVKFESPLFGDLQANINEIMINRTLNGNKYSYVKTSRRKHLKYEFNLRCDSYLELLDFIEASNLDWIILTNWKNEVWKVKIINDDVELKAPSRDIYSIVLELEGYLLTPGVYKCLE